MSGAEVVTKTNPSWSVIRFHKKRGWGRGKKTTNQIKRKEIMLFHGVPPEKKTQTKPNDSRGMQDTGREYKK